MLLLTGGCGPAARAVAAPVTLNLLPGDLLSRVPGLLERYARGHPSVRFASPQTLERGDYQIRTAFAGLATPRPLGLAALDGALRAANFDGRRLLSGAMEAFTMGSQVYGLPYVVMPWSISWRADAFAAAGLQAPAPRWTLEEFESTCAALAARIAAGKVPGARWVCPVAASIAKGPGGTTYHGFLSDAALAAAFGAGFGAPLFGGGRFRLTDPRVLAALGRLVRIAQNYAAPPSALGAGAQPSDNVLGFDALDLPHWPGTSLGGTSPWRQARFPLLPHLPLVPVGYQGLRVTAGRVPAADPTDPRVVAAVRFGLWLYEADQQRLLEGAGLPPMVRDANLQDAFWSSQPAEWDAAGDWRNFADPLAGWPPIDVSTIGAALIAEVQEPGRLAERLAAVDQKLNDAVGRLPAGV